MLSREAAKEDLVGTEFPELYLGVIETCILYYWDYSRKPPRNDFPF